MSSETKQRAGMCHDAGIDRRYAHLRQYDFPPFRFIGYFSGKLIKPVFLLLQPPSDKNN